MKNLYTTLFLTTLLLFSCNESSDDNSSDENNNTISENIDSNDIMELTINDEEITFDTKRLVENSASPNYRAIFLENTETNASLTIQLIMNDDHSVVESIVVQYTLGLSGFYLFSNHGATADDDPQSLTYSIEENTSTHFKATMNGVLSSPKTDGVYTTVELNKGNFDINF